ncbi:unnamed protein product [Musa acuminata var. zebrina]
MEPSLASRGDRGGASTGVFSNRIEREQLVPGDHIYSWRSACIYAHHGIYVGDGMVIHYTGAAGQEIGRGTFVNRIFSISSSPWKNSTPVCERCGVDQSRQNGVTKSCLDCFLAGFNLCLFRYSVTPAFFITQARGGTCTLAVSDPPEVVLHRAQYLLGNNGFSTYSLFNNNCEDLAMYCKTGLLVDASSGGATRSGQISSLAAAMTLVASSPLGFLATGGGGLVVAGAMYSISRYLSI